MHTSFDLFVNSFEKLSVAVPALEPLDPHTIPSWYTRLEMAVQLAAQVKALHKSGKAHCDITLEQIFLKQPDEAVLARSPNEAFDGSYKRDDVSALGVVLNELLFLQKAGSATRPDTNELTAYRQLLDEQELLSDVDAAKFLFQLMCHPEPDMRPTMNEVHTRLMQISKSKATTVFACTPEGPKPLSINLEDLPSTGRTIEGIFKGCVHNAYLSRKKTGLDHKIIYLMDWIILLPRKSPQQPGKDAAAINREPIVLRKDASGWFEDISFYVRSSNKNSGQHAYKSLLRKERAICALLEPHVVLPRQVHVLTFGSNHDKILCLYEKIRNLQSYLRTNTEVDQNSLTLACNIIDEVDLFQKRGIVLRDISPDNILVWAGFEVTFSNFDKAVKKDQWPYLDEPVAVDAYRPPECLLDSSDSWKNALTYSIGCNLLLILSCSKLPWDKENKLEMLAKKMGYRGESQAAKQTLLNPKAPLTDKVTIMTNLAKWMVHPDPKERTPWKQVMIVTRSLSPQTQRRDISL